ncbi:hypothetical protein WJX79_004927 [Trebouxia sp. C0005]
MFDRETCHFELHDIQAVAKSAPAGSRATAVPFASLTQSKISANRLTAFNADQQQETLGRKGFPWQHLVAGAAAGAISRNGLNVLRAGPQKAIDFFSFELYKNWLGARMGSGPASVLSSAALAGATSTVILHPIEVVRSRVTCDRTGRYSQGITAAVRSIISKEGPLVLYTGLGSSLAAVMPEAAVTYGLFDLLTKAYMRKSNKETPGVGVAVAAGIVSCCLGQTVSFPLETISRRLQVGMANGAKMNLDRTIHGVLAEGGILGFYRGFRGGSSSSAISTQDETQSLEVT